jgi:hypothetical protein
VSEERTLQKRPPGPGGAVRCSRSRGARRPRAYVVPEGARAHRPRPSPPETPADRPPLSYVVVVRATHTNDRPVTCVVAEGGGAAQLTQRWRRAQVGDLSRRSGLTSRRGIFDGGARRRVRCWK